MRRDGVTHRVSTCPRCAREFEWWQVPTKLYKRRFCSRSCRVAHGREARIEDVFWLRVERRGDDECWPWQGASVKFGYGHVYHQNVYLGTSNRIALELSLGRSLGDGMFACHRCDNPPCCNPAHLFEGTARDNAMDAARKGRLRPPDNRGIRHGMAKLSEADVAEIRSLRKRGVPALDIAERFGIKSFRYVYTIATGRAWSHLKEA